MRALPLALLFACERPLPIDDAPLAGVVGGVDWTFSAGQVDPWLSEPDAFFGALFTLDYEPCGFGTPGGAQLVLNLPSEAGDYAFSDAVSGSFVTAAQDDDPETAQVLPTLVGRLRVEAVGDGLLSGGLTMRYDDDNTVSGTFELSLCED